MRHATELGKILDGKEKKEILTIYSDGGADHRLNFLSVQLSIICLFLKHDLDALTAVHTSPGHSWKNPAERVMSILNLGLQAVGVTRNEIFPEYEDLLWHCNNMKENRKVSEKNRSLKGALQASRERPVSLISAIFEQLKLKGQPFKIFPSCTEDGMADLEASFQKIDGALSCRTTKAAAAKLAKYQDFISAHCIARQYTFSLLKCSNALCLYHKPPYLPEVFKELQHLPDPTISPDGTHYMPFSELYGKTTDKEHRPLSNPAPSKESHGLPFNRSAQTAGRVKRTVLCLKCDNPRVLHAAEKLKTVDICQLDRALEDIDCSCGTTAEELAVVEQQQDILCKVFVRFDLRCNDPVEIPYCSGWHKQNFEESSLILAIKLLCRNQQFWQDDINRRWSDWEWAENF